MLKKIFVIILIFLSANNIFLPNNIFATYDGIGETTLEDITIDYNTYKEDSESGSSKVGNNSEKKPYKIKESTMNSLIKNLVKFGNIIPSMTRVFMTIVAKIGNTSSTDSYDSKGFSIQKLVFNKIPIFDINFFQTNSNDSDIQENLKIAISKFYYLLRTIAIVGSLLILIYSGIRIALSSIAMEKAKYKNMIIGWLEGFIILMLLPIIMIAILKISGLLLDLCESIMTSICGQDVLTLEDNLFDQATTSTEKGFSLIIPTIMYWMLTFYQLKFFIMYGKRLFNTAFLITISPLVIIQNMFDKVGDGQAQAFKVWLNEYATNILIQPLHALLYMIFMSIASNIIETAPILALVFMAALSRGERVFKNVFRFKDSITVNGMKDNLSAKNLSKIGR